MHQLRRLAGAARAAAAFAAGGSAGPVSDAVTGPPTTAAPAARELPPPRPSTNPKAVPIAAALAPYANLGTPAAPGRSPRTVRHAMGETPGLPAYSEPAEIEGVEVVGTIQKPNLDAIARLRPDLIVSSRRRHGRPHAQLAQIAPTVFAERPGVAWKQHFQLVAQAVGREAEAPATVERYRRRVADLDRQPFPVRR